MRCVKCMQQTSRTKKMLARPVLFTSIMLMSSAKSAPAQIWHVYVRPSSQEKKEFFLSRTSRQNSLSLPPSFPSTESAPHPHKSTFPNSFLCLVAVVRERHRLRRRVVAGILLIFGGSDNQGADAIEDLGLRQVNINSTEPRRTGLSECKK